MSVDNCMLSVENVLCTLAFANTTEMVYIPVKQTLPLMAALVCYLKYSSKNSHLYTNKHEVQ